MAKTSSFTPISTRRRQIAELARTVKEKPLTTLAHHIDVNWLKEAYRLTRKDGAVGIDGQTAPEYAEKLEENLQSLLNRAKSGTYRAPPVRRVHIPKGKGDETRPIGIPTFEDKVLQRAVAMVLEEVYEQEFRRCSYGFRPRRSAHQALEALRRELMGMCGGWVLEVDIEKFFDTMDHGHLRRMLRQRVQDGVICRLIGKWLKAGVLNEGRTIHPDAGTPQGGVISPILANLYLHEVLDVWFATAVEPRMKGRVFLVRYADDAVMVFEEEGDAKRVMDVLPKRFGKYGLTLHPEKTRLVKFKRPPFQRRRRDEGPGNFDMLGFTHYWGRARSGGWVVKRKTAKSRFTRAMQSVAGWCKEHRHMPVKEQWKVLGRKVRGHYGYYGISGNSKCIANFRYFVLRTWRRWLGKRSQKGYLTWERFRALHARYPLPAARLPHARIRVL